jgi:hypothetical protein
MGEGKVNTFDSNLVIEETKKGLGEGPLCLIIACTKCDTQFELEKQSVVIAIGMKTPFIEYLRWIQTSKCRACEENKKSDN